MNLIDLIPEEQKIRYLMRKIVEQDGLNIKPEEIIVERNSYKYNVYNVIIKKCERKSIEYF